jgi:Zn-dependent M28 family amino/carboxypeptidase
MKTGTALLFCLLASVLQPVIAAQEDELLLKERIKAHVEFLADDLLRGRQPGTAGYEIAAAYVASQFRQMGLVPAGTGGKYFQQVPLRRAWLDENGAGLALQRNGKTHTFRFPDDFYMRPGMTHTVSNVDAEMVFAGYGIEAPELDHNDYMGLDVKGKVVVMLAGQPLNFPSEEGAHFASSRERMRAALAAGAIGLITIYTPRTELSFAWNRVGSRVGMPAMGWLDDQGNVFAAPAQIRASAMLHFNAAGVLFEGSEAGLDSLLTLDEAGEVLPKFALRGKIKLLQSSTHETISSPNVMAFLPGSDPLLNDEYVVYTAHLDHIGELHGESQDDRINNGALYNAAGVAVMLETARLFATQQAPRRSVLFVAVTAEEKGLVGSEYFVRNPPVPAQNMVAAINLDMPLLLYDFGDVIAFGAEHSTLGEAAQTAAAEADIQLTPDPFPEQNIFVRSDHYRFVQQGIPAIYLMTGALARDGKTDTKPIWAGFLKDHYHRTSDDLDLPIDYGAAVRFTLINTRIGEVVANDPERPRWYEGDFFGETFSR